MFAIFRDQAEVSDDFVEGLAPLGVADGAKRHARPAHAHRAQLKATDVQMLKVMTPFADLAQKIFDRHLQSFR
jgi:hypothetical protein